jgi:hypothetical protein
MKKMLFAWTFFELVIKIISGSARDIQKSVPSCRFFCERKVDLVNLKDSTVGKHALKSIRENNVRTNSTVNRCTKT